jgi:hypothetical protein
MGASAGEYLSHSLCLHLCRFKGGVLTHLLSHQSRCRCCLVGDFGAVRGFFLIQSSSLVLDEVRIVYLDPFVCIF